MRVIPLDVDARAINIQDRKAYLRIRGAGCRIPMLNRFVLRIRRVADPANLDISLIGVLHEQTVRALEPPVATVSLEFFRGDEVSETPEVVCSRRYCEFGDR